MALLTLKEISEWVCCQRRAQSGEEIAEDTPSTNLLRVASAVVDGQTVTIGDVVYEVDTGAGVTGTNVPVVVAATKASQTLTASGALVDGDTVTIGSTVYRFKTVMTQLYDVLIGASVLGALTDAINASVAGAANYFAGTPAHPTVTAATTNPNVIVATAKAGGTAGNAIATTETGANIAWGNTTLLGGVDPTAAAFTTAFTASVNSNGPIGVNATRPTANTVVVADKYSRALATTETLAGTDNVWANATLVGGINLVNHDAVITARVPSATEVTLQLMVFSFNFAPTAADVTVRTSAGVYRAWDGAITISGNTVIVASSGSTDVAANDIVTVTAQ